MAKDETAQPTTMPLPEEIPDDFGVTYVWRDYGLRAVAENIYQNKTGDISAELEIWHKNGSGEVLLQNDRLNIMSTSAKDSLERHLKNYSKQVNWGSLVLQLSYLIKKYHRQSDPSLTIGDEKPNMKLEWLVSPLIQKDAATVLYGPGGTSKTNLAIYICVLAKMGLPGLSGLLQPKEKFNAYYMDWEANSDSFSRKLWAIQDGMGIKDHFRIGYRRFYRSLVDEITEIQRYVIINDISLAVIDSMNASLGDDATKAEAIYKFYNALRSLGCTILILDHVTKEGMRSDATEGTAYGSVVKFNACRSQWAILKKQTPGDLHIQLGLKHEKMNDGPLSRPLAMNVEFVNDEYDPDTLEEIKFNYLPYQDSDFASSQSGSNFERVFYFLQANPGTTIDEIAEATQLIKEQVKNVILGYNKSKFVKLPGQKPYQYGLAVNDN